MAFTVFGRCVLLLSSSSCKRPQRLLPADVFPSPPSIALSDPSRRPIAASTGVPRLPRRTTPSFAFSKSRRCRWACVSVLLLGLLRPQACGRSPAVVCAVAQNYANASSPQNNLTAAIPWSPVTPNTVAGFRCDSACTNTLLHPFCFHPPFHLLIILFFGLARQRHLLLFRQKSLSGAQRVHRSPRVQLGRHAHTGATRRGRGCASCSRAPQSPLPPRPPSLADVDV